MGNFEGLNAHQVDWLTSKESLTKRLHTFTQNNIALELLYDDWGMVDDNATAWIRRIEWRLDNQVWIAGTVVIPESSINADTNVLTHIGTKSIGDTLFQDPTLSRSDFSFSKLDDGAWSRQSTFYFMGQPLVIIEKFTREFFQATSCV